MFQPPPRVLMLCADFLMEEVMTLITEEKPRLSPFGPGRAAPVDPGRRRSKQGTKGTSAYATLYDQEIEPIAPSVTLARIHPERHIAAFRKAMDSAERIEEWK
jgi:hypothetical protein